MFISLEDDDAARASPLVRRRTPRAAFRPVESPA
jgi:hypothetical protein